MSHTSTDSYYLPQPTHWPIVGSIALTLLALGATFTIHDIHNGGWVLLAGFAVLTYMLFGWFGTVIRESEAGLYNSRVDVSFRWGMSWFIFSEVMFFLAFFGTLFYVRNLSLPDLTSVNNALLWPGFTGGWPSAGPGLKDPFEPMSPWGLPALNTLILLTSGATLTWAHWGLQKSKRGQLILGMLMTVALGISFLAFQAIEYHHAYTEMGLTLGTGVYGATFFMLTGFHGLHVTLGTIMLIVITLRCIKGHFKPEHHFGFEAVAWYWHFVDVVWLLLFVLVYWM